MDSIYLEQLQGCCRDQAAFEQMQQILAIACSSQAEQQKVLFRIILKIRDSLDLDTLLKTTAEEVRRLLLVDRVSMFCFSPNSSQVGEFVSEDVLPGFHSALAMEVHSWGEGCAVQNRQIQAIADIYDAGLQAWHVRALRRFQVRANLTVPILNGNHVWGLLCIHQCSAPRQWQLDEIEFAAQAAIQLGVAIRQAELLTQAQQQAVKLTQALESVRKSQAHLIQAEKLSSLGRLITEVAQQIYGPVNFLYGNLTHATQHIDDLLKLLSYYEQEYSSCQPAESNRPQEVAEIDSALSTDLPQILASMKIAVEHIQQVAGSLCDFSRLEQGERQPVNLHDELENTLLILHLRLKSSASLTEIKIVKEYGDLPLIMGYASQLNQVFMTLLNHAIDAVEAAIATSSSGDSSMTDVSSSSSQPPVRQIAIRTMSVPDVEGGIPRAVICIAHNGAKMPRSLEAMLSDPSNLDQTASKEPGLELSISQKIVVEHHGGEFFCYSQPNQDTEFWIEIPAEQIAISPQKDQAAGPISRQKTEKVKG
jgi:signal transduction histidine kinase